MPPRNGDSSTRAVRSPARAATTAAAGAAEPPPTTTRSASSATGSSVAGTTTRPPTALLLARRGGAHASGHGRHRLEQHVVVRDLGARRLGHGLAVRAERLIEVALL